MQLAALGLFVFEVASAPFTELARRASWRHARGERFGVRDAVQFAGPGDDRVTISGCLYPGVAGRFAAIDTLRRMADEGETYAFVAGDGQVLGTFVIAGLDDKADYFLVDGTPRRRDFTLELERVA